VAAGKPEQDATEIELKLAFDPGIAPRILSHPILADATAPDTRELISIYYDTTDGVLHKAGVFLRVRSTGDGYVQTIKAAQSEGEFLERREWEKPVPTHLLDLDAAEGTALAPLLTPDVRAGLQPRFHTRFRRKTYVVRHDGAEIELAVDEGEVTAGIKASPISELELELKAGDKPALFSLARVLAETIPLSFAVKTKAERGFELLDGGDHAVERAGVVTVTPEMSNAKAFRTITRSCLRQIVANRPGVRDGSPEAVHQMRVGLRRLRAAIGLFGKMLTGQTDACIEEREAIKDKLRWITQELGPARDLDVFAADVLEPLRAAHPDDPEVEAAYRDFKERHAAAYARAIDAVGSDRFRGVLLDLAAWMETGCWAEEDNKLAHARVRPHAKKELSRLRRRVKKRGRHLRALSADKRHRLRIRAKRLRYATEFFAATFPGKKNAKRRKTSLVALETIQDALGTLNDIATRDALLAAAEDDTALRGRSVDSSEEEKWLNEAERAYARFAKVKAFWKA